MFNDDYLLTVLRDKGYKIIFKPHPGIEIQMSDFILPKEVEIANQSLTYNYLFEIGAMLITDFSSVVFDFAYLKKPIIYYHRIPNHNEDGYFNYETMGFGEI